MRTNLLKLCLYRIPLSIYRFYADQAEFEDIRSLIRNSPECQRKKTVTIWPKECLVSSQKAMSIKAKSQQAFVIQREWRSRDWIHLFEEAKAVKWSSENVALADSVDAIGSKHYSSFVASWQNVRRYVLFKLLWKLSNRKFIDSSEPFIR